MHRFKIALLAAACLGASGLANAQPPAGGARPMPPMPANAPPTKSQAPGPNAVIVYAPDNLKTHTVYQPKDLTGFTGPGKMPIVAWGNGGCVNVGKAAEPFLSHLASYGYLAIASGDINAAIPDFNARAAGPPPGAPGAGRGPGGPGGPGAPGAPSAGRGPGGPGGMPGGQTTEVDMKRAIDWAIAENSRQGSPYFGKIDTTKVAVMGTSCGGLQAIANLGDPRVTTGIVFNSGVFPASGGPGGGGGAPMGGATKDSLKAFHGPVAYITGGPGDMASVNAEDDFSRIDKVPVFYGAIEVGHGGTFYEPGGGRYGEMTINWLNWQLRGDAAAGKVFQGPDCTLCKDPVWRVKKKNMP